LRLLPKMGVCHGIDNDSVVEVHFLFGK